MLTNDDVKAGFKSGLRLQQCYGETSGLLAGSGGGRKLAALKGKPDTVDIGPVPERVGG